MSIKEEIKKEFNYLFTFPNEFEELEICSNPKDIIAWWLSKRDQELSEIVTWVEEQKKDLSSPVSTDERDELHEFEITYDRDFNRALSMVEEKIKSMLEK